MLSFYKCIKSATMIAGLVFVMDETLREFRYGLSSATNWVPLQLTAQCKNATN